MKIKTRLLTFGMLLAILPVIIATLFIASGVISLSKETFKKQALNQLISVREGTAEHIENHFHIIESQVLSFSKDFMITYAMRSFKQAFKQFRDDQANLPDEALMRASLERYYLDEYGKIYSEKNLGRRPDVKALLDPLDKDSIAMQYSFISNNSFPIGEKDKLNDLSGGSRYASTHKTLHPPIRDFLQRFGYYDIFLVDDETGDIVYSVFKELDFSTSLIDGPYANSGIAEAFKAADALNSADEVAIVDFKPYGPSYEAPASFIASPIFDEGEKLGILIFQMPVESISKVMTHNQNWQGVGLGKTGKTYIVAADGLMRSNSRSLIEDEETYYKDMANIVDQKAINLIKALGSSVGLQPVDTPATKKALEGQTGADLYSDYRGINVFSAYKPLKINGLDWIIMSEMDESEALAELETLSNSIIKRGGITSLLALIGGGVAAAFIAIYISNPIRDTVEKLKDISEGDGDLTRRMDDARTDELGDLARHFNSFTANIQQLMISLSKVVNDLHLTSSHLSDIADTTTAAIQDQSTQTEHVASAVTDMAAGIEQVARTTQGALASAQTTSDTSQESLITLNKNVHAISSLTKQVTDTASIVDSVSDDTSEIGHMLTIVEGIAEQTNLLALNAAIEAARAGETGRGFAVVADEVRSLAQKTQTSTHDIKTIIEKLQSGTSNALSAINKSQEASNECVTTSESMQAAVSEISKEMDEIKSISAQIATVTEEQSATANEIQQSIVNISQASQTSSSNVMEVSNASRKLSDLGGKLKQELQRYKIS